ncbi:phosphatase PAP2 family protein [Nocardioides mesophilus]|uniref:Phosphatase PAP2 family protein n=1 Tax=Nocardioides mesophilus TaxID=433659 RepID=A0A7G9RCL2_9ACTN|nr:phosphatase PAP2 family protein [Nocardioides mesophilus]QNN53337.1 phosphatase PAP2 family protein [Nocardioides mesophilus]
MATAEVGSPPVTSGQHEPDDWKRDERRSDFVRLGLALVVFFLALLGIQRHHLSMLERDVFRLINDLPPWLLPPLEAVMQLGTRFAPLVIGALVMLVLRRVRLGASIMLAGTVAWLVTQELKILVERGRPAVFLTDLPRELSSGGPGFVSGHTAVATAMAAVAAPYLPRPWRRFVWGLAFAVGFARIYAGVHLPLDVVGGFAVGWFVGTAVHLLIGVPRPRRTPAEVIAMLGDLGIDVSTVEPGDVYAKVSQPFLVTTAKGERLFVKVLDPDPRSSDWVLRFARVVASGERRGYSAMTSLPAAADHEATVCLAARDAGVRVPRVILARGQGAGAVVVLEQIPGHDLSALPPEALTDEVLQRVWREVAQLHEGRIAHRDLVRGNVMLDAAGQVWLVDFPEAQLGASETTRDGDVAELIASLAVAVGAHRAVGSATAVLGAPAVTQALPRLEPFALSPRTRAELRTRPGLLDSVRVACGGGPETTHGMLTMHRLWIPALVAAASYVALLWIAGWSDVQDTVANLGWRWVAVCGAIFVAAPLLTGYALQLGARRRLAIGRSAAAGAVANSVQLIAGTAARRRYLDGYIRSCGAQATDADETVDLVMTAELVSRMGMLLAGLVMTWWQGVPDLETGFPVPALLLVAAATAAVGWLARKAVRRTWPLASRRKAVAHALSLTHTSPERALSVLGAVAAGEAALVVALAAALRAVGPTPPMSHLLIALGGAQVLVALLGVTGLPAVIESVAVTVFCAFGVPAADAVVALLVYALFRYWLNGIASAVTAPRLAPVHLPGTRQPTLS